MIRLGIIGMSEGNGHPYSWSAICNGYDEAAMDRCPFPVIPQYLRRETWPEARLTGVEVVVVWTQDRALSEQIAEAALIPEVVEDPSGLLGRVDAVLLARDDAETHLDLALPILEAGLPVFVDKPLAYCVAEAEQLFAAERYPGQLFTCSSLRFDKGLRLSGTQAVRVGTPRRIEGTIPKSWSKYAIHVIEPSLQILGWPGEPAEALTRRTGRATRLEADFPTGEALVVTTFGVEEGPLRLLVTGDDGVVELEVESTFRAFKESLAQFARAVRSRSRLIPREQTLACINLVELGMSA